MPCPTPEKPSTSWRPTTLFGFPRGTVGRGDIEIQGIVIHCTNDLSYFSLPCSSVGKFARPHGKLKASVHYGIPQQGHIQQYVLDSNTAWGLGPSLAQGASEPTYDACNTNLDWTLSEEGDNEDVAPDSYLIHIALEASKSKIHAKPRNNSDCNCNAGTNEDFSESQIRNLVELLAHLVDYYTIGVDVNHINFFHTLEGCNRSECGCTPLILPILSAVDAYCQSPDFAQDITYRALGEGEEPTLGKVYGEDANGQKREVAYIQMLGGFDGVIRVENVVDWEDGIRDAPVGVHIELAAGIYVRSQPTPIELKAGQFLQGHGQSVTRIIHPDNAFEISMFRSTSPINTSTLMGIRMDGIQMTGRAKNENGLLGAGSTGAGTVGFEDTCGTDIQLNDIGIKGFDIDLILNQTEEFHASNCRFTDAWQSAIWIVNGPNRIAGVTPEFTNVIRFTSCTISGGDALTKCLVVDEGGLGHWFTGCILNGGERQFYGAGMKGWTIDNSYFEGATIQVMELDHRTFITQGALGRSLGGKMSGNIISAGALVLPVIKTSAGNALSFSGNSIFGDPAGYVFNGSADFGNIIALGNYQAMQTWEGGNPMPQSLAYNSYQYQVGPDFFTEPFLIGMNYPTFPASREAVQAWYNNAKRKAIQNDGTIV